MGYGSRYAEKRQKMLEIRLQKVYRQAKRDLEAKFFEFTSKKEQASRKKLKLIEEGKLTEKEYREWLIGQAFQEKQWKDKIRDATFILQHSNEEALKIIQKEQMGFCAENANIEAYKIERDFGFSGAVNFSIYDSSTVQRLVEENPELLPPRRVNGKKDRAWNQGVISNSVTQSIIQGESIDKVANRLARDVASTDMKAMMRYARTAMNSARNAGRMESMRRAQDMGIKIKKEWLATHDNKTRDSHRHLDGQQQDLNKPFISDFGEIMFPGDPEAEPGDVYNCRCDMIRIYPDYPLENPDWRKDDVIDGQSYEEWKDGKKKANPAAEQSEQKKQPMTENEYDEWQKANSTRKRIEEKFEKEYGVPLSDVLAGREDRWIEHRKEWLYEIAQKAYDDIWQVENGSGRCGYVQAADGSKAINAYLRRGEIGRLYSVKEMQKTIDAMERLIGASGINETIVVDRCAGVDALERLGINCGEHGATYRIGHAFCTDGIDMESVVGRINDEFVGSVIVDRGFMSASVVPGKNVFGGSDVTFTILVPSGTNAFITDNTRESEVVFNHGTEQRIVGAQVVEREVTDWDGNKKKRKTIEVFVEIIRK